MISKEKQIKILNIVIFITILFFYVFYSSFVVIFLNKINIDIKTMNAITKTIVLTLLEFLPVLILGFIYRKDLKKEFIIYKTDFKKIFKFSLKWWSIGLMIMALSNVILHFAFHSSPNNENQIQKLLGQLPVYIAITSCFFAPIIEELIFRKSLKNCFKNSYMFIIASGLIFGGLHVITSKDLAGLLYIIPYGAFGSIFAYIYYKTKTIFSTITIHMIHNTILIIISLLSLGVL